MVNVGDNVKIKYDDAEYVGIVIQSTDPNIIVLKLKNGYNMGIDKKRIKNIEIIGKKSLKKETKKGIKEKKGLQTISILHTGGTIVSKVDYETGGVKASFSAEDLIDMFPEIQDIANIRSRNILNIMSEDMRFEHYKKIADEIQKEIKIGIKGVIIGHGTDTLAITATALEFIFENLPIPVLLVGAQRSSDRGSTDAKLNLICASYFIANTDFKGIGVCMHESSNDESCVLLPSTKTKKLHTSRRDAFKAVNDIAIARINYEKKKIEYLKGYKKKIEGKLIVKDKFEGKVAIIKTYPNMNPDLINTLIEKKYRGFVLEGSGLGQAPTNIDENLLNYKALKKFIEMGGIVVLTSNCIFGEIHPYIYKNCRRLEDIGIIFGKDMLTETAYIKLAWLLGNYSKKEAEKLITENLRGEISERRLYEEEII